MTQNQRGISLVELLVTLAILSLVGTIVWGVFFQENSFSQKAVTKSMLQQEANVVATTLTKVHQTSITYTINHSDTDPSCAINIVSTKKDSSPEYPFGNDRLCYSVNPVGNFDPYANDYNVNITISDKKDSNNQVTLNLFLYRLK